MPVYEQMVKDFDIPKDAGPDDIADMVRGLLCAKVAIQGLELKLQKSSTRQGVMTADMLVPKIGPPDGEIEEPDPTNLWELLSTVPLTEVKVRKPRLNMKAVAKVTSMLLTATTRKDIEARVPMMWLINSDPLHFLTWLGVKPDTAVHSFLGLPLTRVPFVEEDRLVLMCARSKKMDPLKCEEGYVLLMGD